MSATRCAITYTLRNGSRIPKPWLEVHNPTTLPGSLPGRAISLGGRSERSWLVRAPLTRRGHFRIEPLHIRTGDPFGFFEASATVGQGVSVIVYPKLEPLPAWRLPAASLEGSHASPGADAPDDAARLDGPAVRPGRQHEPDPLAHDRAARRDPGQGVRARADRRRLDRPRPPARDPGRARRGVDDRGRDPGRGVDRPQGDRREPGRRHDRQRVADRPPAGRPRRPPAPQDHAAARGGGRRRIGAAARDARGDGRPAEARDDGGHHHRLAGSQLGPGPRGPACPRRRVRRRSTLDPAAFEPPAGGPATPRRPPSGPGPSATPSPSTSCRYHVVTPGRPLGEILAG